MSETVSRGSETFRIYSVVLGVGICCSLAIVTTYEWTRPIIQRNRVRQRETAILDVLPNATTIGTYRFEESIGSFEPQLPDRDQGGANRKTIEPHATESSGDSGMGPVFAGFDRHGKLVGLALEARGMGYQDTIGLLYAYSADQQAIVGIRVLESRETPGLGDRIETDREFLKNFIQLDVAVSPNAAELANSIEFVKPGTKTAAWQIDGITGATISSRAIAEMLGESAAARIPRIYSRRSDFVAIAGQE